MSDLLNNDSIMTHFGVINQCCDVLRRMILVLIFLCTVRNDAKNKTFLSYLTLLGL
jgi:hypothetical protein